MFILNLNNQIILLNRMIWGGGTYSSKCATTWSKNAIYLFVVELIFDFIWYIFKLPCR